eukprot:5197195-Pyramimonas_sp.AAC.3
MDTSWIQDPACDNTEPSSWALFGVFHLTVLPPSRPSPFGRFAGGAPLARPQGHQGQGRQGPHQGASQTGSVAPGGRGLEASGDRTSPPQRPARTHKSS